MRVVADTNIVVSGLLWRGNPRYLMDAAREGAIDLFTSAVLLAELEDVLGRERFAQRLTAAEVTANSLVMGYAALASVVQSASIAPVVLADPDDDAVLACAVGAQAAVIVSGDSHLLGLKSYRGMPIQTASELIEKLSSR
jgi:uncharacterized protein